MTDLLNIDWQEVGWTIREHFRSLVSGLLITGTIGAVLHGAYEYKFAEKRAERELLARELETLRGQQKVFAVHARKSLADLTDGINKDMRPEGEGKVWPEFFTVTEDTNSLCLKIFESQWYLDFSDFTANCRQRVDNTVYSDQWTHYDSGLSESKDGNLYVNCHPWASDCYKVTPSNEVQYLHRLPYPSVYSELMDENTKNQSRGTNRNYIAFGLQWKNSEDKQLAEDLRKAHEVAKARRAKIEAYRESGQLNDELEALARKTLEDYIHGMAQLLHGRSNDVVEKAFLTEAQVKQIANAFMTFSRTFNVDIFDLLEEFKINVLPRKLNYHPFKFPKNKCGQVSSSQKQGEIDIYGHKRGCDQTGTTIHEFFHAMMRPHFPFDASHPSYREGLTELLSIASNPQDTSYSYSESTLLVAISGIWGQVVQNSKVGKPIKLRELLAMPELDAIIKAKWSNLATTEAGQRIFSTPQSEEEVLGEETDKLQKRRKEGSLDELKPRIKNWRRLKSNAVQGVLSIIPDAKDRRRVGKGLNRSWGYL